MRSRILLVDQEPGRGRQLLEWLTEAGFAARLVARPEEGWREPPDAVVVTWSARREQTLDAISWVRGRELFLPVLFACEPVIPPAQLAPIFAAGVTAYLPIPFELQAARDLIHRTLRMSVLHRGEDLSGGTLPRRLSQPARVAQTAVYGGQMYASRWRRMTSAPAPCPPSASPLATSTSSARASDTP